MAGHRCKKGKFQSTLPVWGATFDGDIGTFQCLISIHAPRVGSDTLEVRKNRPNMDFNPRSPCGERPAAAFLALRRSYFNPRSPCGERLG